MLRNSILIVVEMMVYLMFRDIQNMQVMVLPTFILKAMGGTKMQQFK